MSQSPADNSSARSVTRYRQGWQALNRLLHDDRSFSGHERHCAFLNCRNGSFATVSALAGMDYPEDGRGIGISDWDFDGRLDAWITNRTAPRVRFIHNVAPSAGKFVSLRLFGAGGKTPRDAIGARIEVELASGTKLLRGLYAGDSFLSQSSAWLHFGLGEDAIKQVTVRWPGEAAEQFSGVESNRFYLLRQGQGKAETWTPPKNSPLRPSEPTLPSMSDASRIVLVEPLPLPAFEVISGGKELAYRLPGKGPWLINLWSSSCVTCLEELKEWTERAKDLRAKELNVLVLSTDQLHGTTDSTNATQALAKMDATFAKEVASASAVRGIDTILRSVLDRWRTLPVPCSLLVDRKGYISSIYLGRVSVDQLLSDAALLGASLPQRRMAATPFHGIWTHDPPTADPLRVCSQFIDQNEIERGINYLQLSVKLDKESGRSRVDGAILGDRFLVLATLLREQKQSEGAWRAYQEAKAMNPRDYRVRFDSGTFLEERGQWAEAAGEYQAALGISPDDFEATLRLGLAKLRLGQVPEAISNLERARVIRPKVALVHFHLANAKQQRGDFVGALAAFREAATLDPTMILAANNAAWIMSTHPEAKLRNGKEALALAEGACERTQHRDPNLLSTLAAAQAEVGFFEQAAKTTEEAITLLKDDPKAARLRERLALYQSAKPYRDPALGAK